MEQMTSQIRQFTYCSRHAPRESTRGVHELTASASAIRDQTSTKCCSFVDGRSVTERNSQNLSTTAFFYIFPNSLFTNRSRLRLKCDSTCAETRFRLSAKRTILFKSAGASVQWTTGSRSVRISISNGSNVGYTMFRGSVKSTGYPLHSPVSPSLSLPCVTVCHHVSTGLYCMLRHLRPEWQEFLLVCVENLDHVSVIPFFDKHCAVCLTVCISLPLSLTAEYTVDLGSGVLYGKPAVLCL